MPKGIAAVCRAERLALNPHSLEAIEVLVAEIRRSLPKLPKDLQVYLDFLIDFVREKSHEMTMANSGLVGSLVYRYFKSHLTHRHIDFDDAMQEGMIGLHRATKLFDHSRGLQFSTYAINWIKQALRRTLQRNNLIAIPVHVQDRSSKCKERWEENQKAATKALAILRLSGMKPPPGFGGDSPPGESIIADRKHPLRIEALDARMDVEDLLSCLEDKRDELVIRLRFLEGLTLEETGERLVAEGYPPVTRERVRQLEAKILGRLKREADRLQSRVVEERNNAV